MPPQPIASKRIKFDDDGNLVLQVNVHALPYFKASIFYQMNYSMVDLHLRNDLIVFHASHRCGPFAALILKTLLDNILLKSSHPSTLQELSCNTMTQSIDLATLQHPSRSSPSRRICRQRFCGRRENLTV